MVNVKHIFEICFCDKFVLLLKTTDLTSKSSFLVLVGEKNLVTQVKLVGNKAFFTEK